MKRQYLLTFLLSLLVFSSESFAIKIVIKSSSEKSHAVTPYYHFNFIPVLINGIDYDFFGGQSTPLESFARQRIMFEFDDEMETCELPSNVNDRFFELMASGWKNIFKYDDGELLGRGMLATRFPPSSVVLIFVATGEIVDPSQVASFKKDVVIIKHMSELVTSSLKAGELVIIKDIATGQLVETLIFLIDEYFIGWDGSIGGFYIQTKEQIEGKLKKAEALMSVNCTHIEAHMYNTLKTELTPLDTNASPSFMK